MQSEQKPVTDVGQAFDQDILSTYAREALAFAIEGVVDSTFVDYEYLVATFDQYTKEGVEPFKIDWRAIAVNTVLLTCLPAKHARHYTPIFLKRYAACIYTVAWKLAQKEYVPPACAAEQLALRALIQVAKEPFEEKGKLPFDFGPFEEHAFGDVNYTYLLERAVDAVHGREDLPEYGVVSLPVSEWFKSLDSRKPYGAVHPFASRKPTYLGAFEQWESERRPTQD